MSDDVDERARRTTRRAAAAVAAIAVVVSAVVTGLVADPWWAGVLLAVVFLVGAMAVAVVVLRLVTRRVSFGAFHQYGWPERRAVERAIKEGRPLDEREVRVARASVDGMESYTRWMPRFWLVLAVLFLVNAFLADGWSRWLMVCSAGLYLSLVPLSARQGRRTVDRYREALSRSSAA